MVATQLLLAVVLELLLDEGGPPVAAHRHVGANLPKATRIFTEISWGCLSRTHLHCAVQMGAEEAHLVVVLKAEVNAMLLLLHCLIWLEVLPRLISLVRLLSILQHVFRQKDSFSSLMLTLGVTSVILLNIEALLFISLIILMDLVYLDIRSLWNK